MRFDKSPSAMPERTFFTLMIGLLILLAIKTAANIAIINANMSLITSLFTNISTSDSYAVVGETITTRQLSVFPILEYPQIYFLESIS